MWASLIVVGPVLPSLYGKIMKKDPVDMDMEKPRKIVYHETEAREGMMVYFGAEKPWYDKGWVNTPDKFEKGKVAKNETKQITKEEFEKIKAEFNRIEKRLEAERLELEDRETILEKREESVSEREKALTEKLVSGGVTGEAKPDTGQPAINPRDIEDASDLSDYLNKEYGLETNYRMGLKKLKKILKGKLDDNSSEDN